MRKFVAASCLFIISSWILLGAVGDALSETRIAVLNVAKILQEAPQAQAAKAALEREFAPKDSKLADIEDEIRDLESTLRRKARSMDSRQREKLVSRIQDKKKGFTQKREDLRALFNDRRNEELAKIQKLVNEIIVEIAEKDNIDLILSEPIVYASDRINLTKKTLAELKRSSNKKRK